MTDLNTDSKFEVQSSSISDADERLLECFFGQHRAEIEDHGFSQRVMRRLPSRANRLNRWWTVLCIAAGMVFFFVVRGWQVLTDALTVAVRTVPALDVFQLTPITVLVAVGVLSSIALLRQVEAEFI